ncbi:CBS domain-containing protein [Actinidia rufa]|uniref:CBS domain-containing protein n=1 Tax=Actinidia rufa TaxID=165716 RepID=A0A7J0DGB0_9ERIC|nr:CBS domain-containing protein [Actinidia rufa]
MAVRLLAYEVADLCLGKPPLSPLSAASATVRDAVSELKSSGESYVSVWSCDHSSPPRKNDCGECVAAWGKFAWHVEPSSSLLEAIDLILQGAQNLVVPIKTNSRRKLQKSSITSHNGREFCWLTQEDIVRFLLSSIGLFSPIPAVSIDTLGIISTEFLSVQYHSPASSAIGAISCSLADQTSVAVVDDEGILIGEISPFTLACCDEMVAAAITTLSAGDLMAYIDCGGPPEDLARVVKARLEERGLERMLEEFTISPNVPSNSSSSSDEESLSPTASLPRSGRYNRSSSYSARMVRRAEAIVCHPGSSSLVAVMIQAIAHRVNYVWVIEEDCSLAGIVTFSNMLDVFYERLQSMA